MRLVRLISILTKEFIIAAIYEKGLLLRQMIIYIVYLSNVDHDITTNTISIFTVHVNSQQDH